MNRKHSWSFSLVRTLAGIALAGAFGTVVAQQSAMGEIQMQKSVMHEVHIVRLVKEALQERPALRDLDVSVGYDDGAVVLDGILPSQNVVNDVSIAVAKVNGVKAIVNNLRHE